MLCFYFYKYNIIYYLYILCMLINVNSIMAVRSTGPLLSRLRDLMKLKYLGEPIQGYIVLSEDAHQVNFHFCTSTYYIIIKLFFLE